MPKNFQNQSGIRQSPPLLCCDSEQTVVTLPLEHLDLPDQQG